jgi:hypothetical protein
MVSSLVIKLGMVRQIIRLFIRMIGHIVQHFWIEITAEVVSYENKKLD